jgi:very-short-patch-repair endonuclease
MDGRFQTLYLKCESQIERKFLQHNYELLTSLGYLSSQEVICSYRVDFLLATDNRTFVIECDGRSYHIDSKTFDLDRLKNLTWLFQGIIPIRFSGNQINRWPTHCGQWVKSVVKRWS